MYIKLPISHKKLCLKKFYCLFETSFIFCDGDMDWWPLLSKIQNMLYIFTPFLGYSMEKYFPAKLRISCGSAKEVKRQLFKREIPLSDSGINMREIHFPVATRTRDTSADE